MKDRAVLQRLWRAAHAVGAAGLFALAAMLFLSLPARAEAPRAAAPAQMQHAPLATEGAAITPARRSNIQFPEGIDP
ncbi:hypothetical protein P6F26_15810 [Roseibacterium sp. SDUM158017]|uniref:hypothetical protein n=1 Tax=Roseicyclus salinarum TaxID=3036773 RepID=UPI002414F959|nr:hypothetical protein [Roseibacterium sp. SDUM158017]MDG4649912.1 hypothetical protein [Roseibacterium sp. SDUM158017]